MKPATKSLTVEDLKVWANDPHLAKQNLHLILNGLGESGASESEDLAGWITETLENLGRPNDQDLDALLANLSNRKHDLVYWSIVLLGRFGTEAKAALPRLYEIIQSDEFEDDLQAAAKRNVKKIEGLDT